MAKKRNKVKESDRIKKNMSVMGLLMILQVVGMILISVYLALSGKLI